MITTFHKTRNERTTSSFIITTTWGFPPEMAQHSLSEVVNKTIPKGCGYSDLSFASTSSTLAVYINMTVIMAAYTLTGSNIAM